MRVESNDFRMDARAFREAKLKKKKKIVYAMI